MAGKRADPYHLMIRRKAPIVHGQEVCCCKLNQILQPIAAAALEVGSSLEALARGMEHRSGEHILFNIHQKGSQGQFAFIRGERQSPFMALPQRYVNSLSLGHCIVREDVGHLDTLQSHISWRY